MSGGNRKRNQLACPSYVELLGQFARVSIERDALRQAIEGLHASRAGWSAAHDKLLEIVSRELTGNPQTYRDLPCVSQQHDAVIAAIAKLIRPLAPQGSAP